MAALALAAVGALMAVVLPMAGNTQWGSLALAGPLVMALSARELGVCTRKGEGGLFGVIKAPLRPIVRRVATLALSPQTTLMHIIGAVTIDALSRRAIEGHAGVALGAVDQPMQPDQRIAALVVIESNAGVPVLLTVTTVAALLEHSPVWILTAMTGLARDPQLLLGGRGGVAAIAGDTGVCAHECKVMPPEVIVGDARLPMIVIVASGAIAPKPGGVNVVGTMTAEAIFRQFQFVVATAMAGQAVKRIVSADQCIAGFLEVVVLGALPLDGGVAAATVRSARAAMLIVGGMTAIAARGCGRITTCDMAGVTGHPDMGTSEPKTRLIMVEVAAAPAERAVALAARLLELTVMYVVVAMAIGATGTGRCLRPELLGLVAGAALECTVCAVQSKVSELMIKLRLIDLHDVGVATLVLGMTGLALTKPGIRHAAVIAVPRTNIGGDLLVAVETQGALGALVAAIVAAGALAFPLGVGTHDLPRHQQGLH